MTGSAAVEIPRRRAPLHAHRARRSGARGSWLGRPWLGIAAALAAAFLVALDVVAVGLASSGEFVPATVLAWCGIVLSGIAVVLGVLSAALRRGPWFGVAGAALAVVANPYLLTVLLEWLSR